MITLSERIRALRGERTFAQFAAITGLSAQTLHAAEHHKSIRVGTLREIATACKLKDDAWISLLILWIRTEIGDRDFSKLVINPCSHTFPMHEDMKPENRIDVGGLVLSMFFKLTNEEQEQILKTLARPSVRMCLPAINSQYENPKSTPESWVDNEVIENVTRGLRAGDILYSNVGTHRGKSARTAVRKKTPR